eukprot:CAMPEP_0194325700 /NCGR_PEP_ID=MMETSP0171-20130528/32510_1 /TAXON_ID=218684 /ORGANISM="Corethron pennatum, Strain L29A3" /LENGTH=985 /DNA_ID=CAMNT_0039084965 /DNA_START=24 /DNA_END=2981 /DNA_ORIENTATION=-
MTEPASSFLSDAAAFWSALLADGPLVLSGLASSLHPEALASFFRDFAEGSAELRAVSYVLQTPLPAPGRVSLPQWRAVSSAAASFCSVPSWSDYLPVLRSAGSDAVHFFGSLSALLFLTLRPVLNVVLIVGALLVRIQAVFFSRVVTYHRSMSSQGLLLEAGGAAAAVCLYFLRSFIRRRRYLPRTLAWLDAKKRAAGRKYRQVLDRVNKFNRTLAAVFPHLLYAVAAASVRWMAPGVVRYACAETALISVLAVWYPVGRTVWALRKWDFGRKGGAAVENLAKATKVTKVRTTRDGAWIKNQPKAVRAAPKKKKFGSIYEGAAFYYPRATDDEIILAQLQFWAAAGLLSASTAGASLLPLVERAMVAGGLAPHLRELHACVLLWLHIPTGAAELVYRAACVPMAGAVGSASRAAASRGAGTPDVLDDGGELSGPFLDKIGTFLGVFVFFKTISETTKKMLLRLIVEGYALFPALVTLGTPSFLTLYGCIYAGMVIPVVNTVRAGTSATPQRVRWLEYWCAHTLLSIALRQAAPVLAWVPFSTHATLLLLIWLQLPAFGGAAKVYTVVVHELVCFGVLEAAVDEDVETDNTVVMRLAGSIYGATRLLPRAKDAMWEEKDAGEGKVQDGSAVDGKAPASRPPPPSGKARGRGETGHVNAGDGAESTVHEKARQDADGSERPSPPDRAADAPAPTAAAATVKNREPGAGNNKNIQEIKAPSGGDRLTVPSPPPDCAANIPVPVPTAETVQNIGTEGGVGVGAEKPVLEKTQPGGDTPAGPSSSPDCATDAPAPATVPTASTAQNIRTGDGAKKSIQKVLQPPDRAVDVPAPVPTASAAKSIGTEDGAEKSIQKVPQPPSCTPDTPAPVPTASAANNVGTEGSAEKSIQQVSPPPDAAEALSAGTSQDTPAPVLTTSAAKNIGTDDSAEQGIQQVSQLPDAAEAQSAGTSPTVVPPADEATGGLPVAGGSWEKIPKEAAGTGTPPTSPQ